MVAEIWAAKNIPAGKIDKEVTKLFADRLWKSTVKGYGETLFTVDWTTPDYKMLTALQENVWQFSAAKNYTQLRELGNALVDENGKVRTEAEFIREAVKINDEQVVQWLRTERNLALAGGQMASKWVEIQADKEIFPFVQFDVVLDGHTTDICLPLADMIVPVDSEFLDTYYPPNHFGERTTLRQLTEGPATEDLAYPEIPKMFQRNLAKDGLVFPEGHAYFNGLPEDVRQAANKLIPPPPDNG